MSFSSLCHLVSNVLCKPTSLYCHFEANDHVIFDIPLPDIIFATFKILSTQTHIYERVIIN